MSPGNVPLAARNLSRAFINHAARLYRRVRHRARRGAKHAGELGKRANASARGAVAAGRDAGIRTHRATVSVGRYAQRVKSRVWPRVRRDFDVRRELGRAARGSHPIIVGPWLSEVGYEALYWVPFLRWFRDRYRVDRSRLVIVSRGGVHDWYADLASQYVELLDLFTPEELAALNAARQQHGDQKQHGLSDLDRIILDRVRARDGLASATVCHPSAMFRLLRQFWLGNESLEYAQAYLRFAPIVPLARPDVPPLPARFTAVKFYTGKAVPDTLGNRRALRGIVERLAARGPVVALDTGLALDEHEDFLFRDVPGVVHLSQYLTPQNNLGVQTAVIGRADRFVGTCGSLAWLAPMLGTPTVAVFADDDFLGPHLYAARLAYRQMGAAPFGTFDLTAMEQLDSARV